MAVQMQFHFGTLLPEQKKCLEESGFCIIRAREGAGMKAFRDTVIDVSVDGVEVKLKVLAVQLGENPGMICQRQ